MTALIKLCAVSVLVLLTTIRGYGQSNVYSLAIYAGGITYYPSRWVVGSSPYRFGLEEYSYSKDAAGYVIMYSPDRERLPSDTFHRRTQVLLGPVSFSVPLRPAVVAILFSVAAFALGVVLFRFRLKTHRLFQDEARVD